MLHSSLKRMIEETGASGVPEIEIIRRAKQSGPSLGVFPSSFNPITVAHIEIIRRAAREFSLAETLALAGKANADKADYDCPLEKRLQMLFYAFEEDDPVSIGLSSHAYFSDMLEALERVYTGHTDFYFIVGFDTFERVLDPEDRYTAKYHRRFTDRIEALEYIFSRSHFIVAGRAGAGENDLRALIKAESATLADRTHFLDLPMEIAERSATEVRSRLREGLEVHGLVPDEVERYINRRGLYKAAARGV